MKRLLAFIRKEFLHIFRDPRTMIILFGMPVAQLLIFGFVISNEIRDAKIAILDKSNDQQSREIVHRLLSSGYFRIGAELETESSIEACFKANQANLVVVFEPDFGRKLERNHRASMQLIADASDPNMAEMLSNYVQGIVFEYVNDLNRTIESPTFIQASYRMIFNPALKGVYMFVPGTMALILMLISAMMTSITIAREKEMGTMEVLLVSPLNPFQILIGKLTPYFFLSLINASLILLMAYFVFGLPILGSSLLLVLVSMLFILMALSLGVLISTVAKNQEVAMFISMFALLLPTLLLSGFIFPIENMPKILQYLSILMPPKYFIIILKNLMIKGIGMSYIWKEVAILGLFLLVFMLISIRKFKIRLE